jgi:hypothetical protein
MKNIVYILIIGLFSCTTLKKAEGYFEKYPDKAEYVAKKYILSHELPGAKICLEAFPQKNKIDTFSIVKDSLIVEKMVDSIFSTITKTKFINREVIKNILIPCKDSVKIVTKTIYDPKFEVLYNDINKKYINVSDAHSKIKKVLFWTWFWIILLATSFGVYKYKK